jgi:hypothetical protein
MKNKKNKKYYTIGAVPKFNKKKIVEAKSILLTDKYMTAYFPKLVQTLK